MMDQHCKTTIRILLDIWKQVNGSHNKVIVARKFLGFLAEQKHKIVQHPKILKLIIGKLNEFKTTHSRLENNIAEEFEWLLEWLRIGRHRLQRKLKKFIFVLVELMSWPIATKQKKN